MGIRVSQAFVLRAVAYREADLVVDLLTLDHGRLSALARGARKSRRRFGGVLDYFQLLQVEVRSGRGGMGTLQSAQLLRSWDVLRRDVDAYYVAAHLLEVARLGVHEGDPDVEFFHLLESALDAVEAGVPLPQLVPLFQIKALAVLGYAPVSGHCPGCGAAWSERGAGQVDGRIVCRACCGPRAAPLSLGGVRTLQAAAARPLATLWSLRIGAALAVELTPLLETGLAEALGRRPKTLATLPKCG